jgi:hypothetical protein
MRRTKFMLVSIGTMLLMVFAIMAVSIVPEEEVDTPMVLKEHEG